MERNFGKDEKKEEDDEFSNTKVVELLKLKVKLDNGEDGYVFTKNTEDNQRGKFRCHVCNVFVTSQTGMVEHAMGKNHTRRMQMNFHPHENFTKIVIKESSSLSTDVGGKVIKAPGVDIPDLAPGEPVPPGFEDIVTRVPEIMATLDAMKAPLIGLEYLAEITPVGDEIEPKYCCLLCNKKGDPRTVLAHLVCFNHRIKYIGSYFPRTNTALALIPKVKEFKRGTGEVLAKIVKAIETKFGRLNPVIVDGAIFDQKKEEVYREMRAGRHFHETAESNYELMVDMDFIMKCAPDADKILTIDIEMEEAKKKSTALKNETSKNKQKNFDFENLGKRPYDKTLLLRNKKLKPRTEPIVNTISSSSSPSYSRSRSKSYSRSRSRSRSGSYTKYRSRCHPRYRSPYKNYDIRSKSRSSPYYCRSRSRSQSRSQSRSRSHSLSRSRSRSHSRSRSRSGYRRYCSSSYRVRSPGYGRSYRTPRYDSFYIGSDYSFEKPKSTQVKVAELRNQRRKRDQYAEYVKKLEKDMTKTLKNYNKNPEKHPLYPEEWKKFWSRRYKELTAEGIDASKHDFKPEWIKFWLVRMKELHNEELEKKKEKFRAELGLNDLVKERSLGLDSDVIEISPTPFEEEKANVTVDDIKNTWKALTGSEIKSTKDETPEKLKTNDTVENDSTKSEPEEPVRVITVLRLLTALESQLGSLGPRVNNLLAQAIALEKKKPMSSDSLIEVSENNVLFETVKEKLKGQLFAGIVEKHMIAATRTAIQNVAELFNSWKIRKENPKQVVPTPIAPMISEPLIVPGIGAVDKISIAQQIAAALIAQGKTNVTEEELEQLINAVVGMAQAKPISTPATPVGSFAASAFKSDISCNSRKEADLNSKSPSFHQILSSVSQSNWSTEKVPTKQMFDEASHSKSKRDLLQKNFKDMTEEDMKTLLQNFKELTSEEQQSLIAYLKELESKDPESVEKLRKFVSPITETAGKSEGKTKEDSVFVERLSPFSMREGGANPFIDENSKAISKDLDDDEDDYSYEDIYKAAEEKVSGKSSVKEQQQKNTKLSQYKTSPEKYSVNSKASEDPERVLNDAKVTIDNIMGQLPAKFNVGGTRSVNLKTTPTTISTNLKTESPASFSSQSMYLNSARKMPNNLLNDYNYQDDIFGYGNNGYQNYSESYSVEPQSEPYRQLQSVYNSYSSAEPYNNYENWNETYTPYSPRQQNNYNCPPPPPTHSSSLQVMNSNYNRLSGPYHGSPHDDYNPALYNAYREYY